MSLFYLPSHLSVSHFWLLILNIQTRRSRRKTLGEKVVQQETLAQSPELHVYIQPTDKQNTNTVDVSKNTLKVACFLSGCIANMLAVIKQHTALRLHVNLYTEIFIKGAAEELIQT